MNKIERKCEIKFKNNEIFLEERSLYFVKIYLFFKKIHRLVQENLIIIF